MKYFIALDANEYKLPKDVNPVSLEWKGQTIKSWVAKLKYTKNDILIGHSLGAAIALIASGIKAPKELRLYSPSPIFKETIHYLNKKNRIFFGKKRCQSVKDIPVVNCKIKIYNGSLELCNMKRAGYMIYVSQNKAQYKIIKGKNHQTVAPYKA